MIDIIFIVIAIIIISRKNLSLSQNLELRRPRTYLYGAVIIGIIIVRTVILSTRNSDVYTATDLLIDVGTIAALLAPLLFIKQRKANLAPQAPRDPKHTSKTVAVVGWVIILGFVGVLIYAILGQ